MPDIDLQVIANLSYWILLVAYIMRDILWLRVLTVISLGFEIPYFFFQPDLLWDGIGWDIAFIAINAYWIACLVYERRPVHFTAEQKRLPRLGSLLSLSLCSWYVLIFTKQDHM